MTEDRRKPSPIQATQRPPEQGTLIVPDKHVVSLLLYLTQGDPMHVARRKLSPKAEETKKTEDLFHELGDRLKARKEHPEDFSGRRLLIQAAIISGHVPRVKSAIPLSDLSENRAKLSLLIAKGYDDATTILALGKVKQRLELQRKELMEIMGAKSEDHLTAMCISLHRPAKPEKPKN